jgi:hypothetical protein
MTVSNIIASQSKAHKDNPLFFPVTDGDDAFTLAVPLEIVARVDWALEIDVVAQKESRPHIFPDKTLYSPLSD